MINSVQIKVYWDCSVKSVYQICSNVNHISGTHFKIFVVVVYSFLNDKKALKIFGLRSLRKNITVFESRTTNTFQRLVQGKISMLFNYLCSFGRPYILGLIEPIGLIAITIDCSISLLLTSFFKKSIVEFSVLFKLSNSLVCPNLTNFIESFRISLILSKFSFLSNKTIPEPLSGLAITIFCSFW